MGRKLRKLLQRLREERGFSRRGLARRAGIDAGYYCKAEKKEIPFSVNALLRVADALQASPSQLLAAAGLIRTRFPYEAITPGVQRACLKLAQGERLSRDDKDELLHLLRAWLKKWR